MVIWAHVSVDNTRKKGYVGVGWRLTYAPTARSWALAGKELKGYSIYCVCGP